MLESLDSLNRSISTAPLLLKTANQVTIDLFSNSVEDMFLKFTAKVDIPGMFER